MKMKYQQGGTFNLPFVVYQPYIVPTEETQTNSSSTKQEGNTPKMEQIFKLLDDVKEKALPGDLDKAKQTLINLFDSIQYKMQLGNSVDSFLGETSSITYEYLTALSLINKMQFQYEQFKTAKTQAIQSGAIDEYTIDSRGRVIVGSKNGFEWKTPEEIFENPDKYRPITNSELLDLRSQGMGGLAFNSESISAVASGTSYEIVTKLISDAIDKLGKDAEGSMGYAKVNAGEMIQGLQDYVKAKEKTGKFNASVEDLYKAHLLTENQATQAKWALSYIYRMLPQDAISLLKMKSDGTADGAKYLIDSLVTSKMSNKIDLTSLSLEDGPSSTSDSDSDSKSNPYLQLIRGEGGTRKNMLIIPRGENKGLKVTGVKIPVLPEIHEEMSIDRVLASGIDNLDASDKRGICFGDQLLDPSDLKHIMYDNEGAYIVTLPVIKDAFQNPRVNTALLKDYSDFENELKQYSNLSESAYKEKEKELLKKYELDDIIDPATGLIDMSKTANFLVIGAYTTDKLEFDKKSNFIERIENPSEHLVERIIQGLSTDKDKKNYELDAKDKWSWIEWGYDDIYRGNVYIPLRNNPTNAMNAQGNNISEAKVSENERLTQNLIKLTQMKPTYDE